MSCPMISKTQTVEVVMEPATDMVFDVGGVRFGVEVTTTGDGVVVQISGITTPSSMTRRHHNVLVSIAYETSDGGGFGKWYNNLDKLVKRKVSRFTASCHAPNITRFQVSLTLIGRPAIGTTLGEGLPDDPSGKFSDFTFLCGESNVRVAACRVLLARISPVFISMFTGGFNDVDEVAVEEGAATIREIVQFSEDGIVKIDVTNYDLVVACNKYLITEVVDMWEYLAKHSMSGANAVDIMHVGELIQRKTVVEKAAWFIKNNLKKTERADDLTKEELMAIFLM